MEIDKKRITNNKRLMKEIIFAVLFESYLEWDDAEKATEEIMKALKT